MPERDARAAGTAKAMHLLLGAHAEVGGDVVSAGGTGTWDLNTWATEIQAGSYALMDTAYAQLDLPFRQALSVLATVVSVSPRHAVADCGLKALGMDHGNPTVAGATVLFCSDELVTFVPGEPVRPGDRIRVARTRRSHRRVPLASPRDGRRAGRGVLAGRSAGLVRLQNGTK